MSRTKHSKYHRKKVHNSYLQKILHIYYDDFGGTRYKHKELNGMVRAREKERLFKEIKSENI